MQIPVHQTNGIAFLEGFGNAEGDSFTPRTFSGISFLVKSALIGRSYVEDTGIYLLNHDAIFPAKGIFV